MNKPRHELAKLLVFVILLDLFVFLVTDIFHHLNNKPHIAVRVVNEP